LKSPFRGITPLLLPKTVWGHFLRQGSFAPKREPCCLSRDEKIWISILESQGDGASTKEELRLTHKRTPGITPRNVPGGAFATEY
jgi:hypothetical protein